MPEKTLMQKIFTMRHMAYFVLVAFIIVASYLLVVSGVLDKWAALGGWWLILMTFVGGLCFTSFSTTPLSVAIFVVLARDGNVPLYQIALLGGFGAMLGDAGLISTVKMSILDDLFEYFVRKTHGAFAQFAIKPIVRVLAVVLGALVIASPLPDEVGLSMMGMTQLPMRYIMLVSFVINSAAIAGIIYFVR